MIRTFNKMIVLTIILSMVLPLSAFAYQPAVAPVAPNAVIDVTILHTNDFHGYLETDYRGRGGSAYMATQIEAIRTEKGADSVVLLDAGDEYFGGAPIGALTLGESVIDIYNMLGYDAATYGNHEFDKGQTVLVSRTNQANFPYTAANVVLEGTDWDLPDWALPYVTMTVGTAGNQAVLGIIGLAGEETPVVTLKGTTDGLVFKDLTETILHYYDEVAAQSDAIVILAHMGTQDSGEYDGLQTVAQNLINAGNPVDLMIGGHQHEAISTPVMVGNTAIVCAGYYGRYLGQVDIQIDTDANTLTVADYTLHTIGTALAAEPTVEARVQLVRSGCAAARCASRLHQHRTDTQLRRRIGSG
jgi:2',3'-cyclic-nucleotide 2'-phosphodiesterase (5'-nucleotidase family)